jgi:indolepyruvate ferredoxin oxidoreductase
MGYAAQKGWLPVSLEAFERAIELNGVSVDMNKTAIAWGRLAAVNLAEVEAAAEVNPQQQDNDEATEEDLEAFIKVREEFLTQYQDSSYAGRYRNFVDHVRQVEQRELGDTSELTRAVARYLFKLMAYKDEYEVARLFTEFDVRQYLDREFEGDYRIEFNMAPPLLGRRDPRTGRYPKIQLGPWMRPVFLLLAKLRFLRGTVFDIFGKSEHRRRERQLIDQYRTTLEGVLAKLSPHNQGLALEIASVPEMIRGYDVVKERYIEEAAKHEKALLDRFYGRLVNQHEPEKSELIETVQLEG